MIMFVHKQDTIRGLSGETIVWDRYAQLAKR